MRAAFDPRSPLCTLALAATLIGCGDDSTTETVSASDATSAATDSSGASSTMTATSGVSVSVSGSASHTTETTSQDSDATDGTTDGTAGTETDTAGGTTSGGVTDTATGSTTATDTDTDTNTDTDATTGGLGEPVGAVAPAWIRAADGLSSLGPPRVAALPDGDVIALITGGLYAHEIVLADGDADEVVLAAMYTAPALARFDGASGALKEGRMLARLGEGAPFGMSVLPRELRVASDGDLLVVGTWTGTTEFFPGTGDAATHVTLMKILGNDFHRAEDPFAFRMRPDGSIAWFVRGRTPAPITTTWFNYGRGLAPLPDGGLVIAGDYELSGFVVADNTGGAKTMSGTLKSYYARLGADGEPAWIYRNSIQGPFSPLRSGDDGALYAFLPRDATVFEDSGGPWMTGSEPGLSTSVLGRLDPDGGVLWGAHVARSAPSGPLRGFEPTIDGDVLVVGDANGEVLLRDASDATMSTVLDAQQAFVAGFSAAGEGLYLRGLGASVGGVGLTLRGDDGVYVVAQIAAPFELEVAGEVTPLPELGADLESAMTTILRIDGAGEVVSAQVLGVDLPIASLAWSGDDQGSFLVTGGYWCDSGAPFVIAEGGEALVALKTGCDMEPNDDQRGYVAAVPRLP
ncbi:MAG: hypothetical protein R3B09_09060 [Nannocystaceae bacterium]